MNDDDETGPSVLERMAWANAADTEWPFVRLLITLCWEHRILLGRIYGYGCGLICLSWAAAPDLGQALRGYPLGLGLLFLTSILTNHDGVWRYRHLQTRAQRRRVCVIILAGMILGALILPGAS